MTLYQGPYYSARRCDGSARPGTNALVSWYLGAYAGRGARNLGTYACKKLGSGWSIHAERRAADLGTAPYGGVDSAWGWAFADALRLNSAELGIQLIILGRKVWSARYPGAGWRAYGGEYHGHAHVELTPAAATSLTPAKIQDVIGGRTGMLVRKGDSSEEVKFWQWVLIDLGYSPGEADGDYGPKTAAAIDAYRKEKGHGPITYLSGWQAASMLFAAMSRRSGAKGSAGKPGPAGPAGPQGPAGPAGPAGELAGTLDVQGGTLHVTTTPHTDDQPAT